MAPFRQSFLSVRLNPPEFYDFPHVSGIVEVTLPQPRKQLSIINHLAESVWETLVGVCWCTVDRVCRHSYPQITLYWAAGRRRGCRGMKSAGVGLWVPLIEAQRASRLPPASEQLFLPLTLHLTGVLVTPACTLTFNSFHPPLVLFSHRLAHSQRHQHTGTFPRPPPSLDSSLIYIFLWFKYFFWLLLICSTGSSFHLPELQSPPRTLRWHGLWHAKCHRPNKLPNVPQTPAYMWDKDELCEEEMQRFSRWPWKPLRCWQNRFNNRCGSWIIILFASTFSSQSSSRTSGSVAQTSSLPPPSSFSIVCVVSSLPPMVPAATAEEVAFSASLFGNNDS